MSQTTVGVIGGSGLYELSAFEVCEEVSLNTPFGKPSSKIIIGSLGDAKVCFISRHGKGHIFSPSEVPYQANMYALKILGAEWCIGIGAVGSLREEIAPRSIVIPDQFINRTDNRQSTFFGDGIVAHVNFADPFCPVLRDVLIAESRRCVENSQSDRQSGKQKVFAEGTYVCMEGPAFSTRAESQMYRSWNADIIGMTNLTEAKLAREAEIAYASLSLVTDYDCWRSKDEDVDIAEIFQILKDNSKFAQQVIDRVCRRLPLCEPSELAAQSLSTAIITERSAWNQDTVEKLSVILKPYL